MKYDDKYFKTRYDEEYFRHLDDLAEYGQWIGYYIWWDGKLNVYSEESKKFFYDLMVKNLKDFG